MTITESNEKAQQQTTKDKIEGDRQKATATNALAHTQPHKMTSNKSHIKINIYCFNFPFFLKPV